MSDFDDNLGPLARLVGVWEGDKGEDLAPETPNRQQTARSEFRERIVFEPIGRVDNHEQILYGLRYQTVAWRIGSDQPFHEESGYWLYDGERELVMRCFIVPRGISVIAGGQALRHAESFDLAAKLGSATFGICSNPFLDREFRTVSYTLNVKLLSDDAWSYHEDTVLVVKGRNEPFHHTDSNTLTRVASESRRNE